MWLLIHGLITEICVTLWWRHNDHAGVSNHQPHGCLLNRLFRRNQRKHQSSASLAFVREIHRDRWISRTNGQLRGKCFHLMTSSWVVDILVSDDIRTAIKCYAWLKYLVGYRSMISWYSLQWRHMSVMVSQIIGNSTVCSTACLTENVPGITVLLWGNPPFTDVFPSQKASNA